MSAGRWPALTVDEFQDIVENLQDIVENMRGIVENLKEQDPRCRLGSPIGDHSAVPRSAGSCIENIPDPASPSNALDAGRIPSKIQARCCMLRVASRSPRICYPFNS